LDRIIKNTPHIETIRKSCFTVDSGGNVTGVAVSAAVGKENASAAAFNYESGSGVQNSAFPLL